MAPCGPIDFDLCDQQCLLFEFDLRMNLSVRCDYQRTAVLMRHVTRIAGSEPDRILSRAGHNQRVVHRDLPVVGARRVILWMKDKLRTLPDALGSRFSEAKGFEADHDTDPYAEQIKRLNCIAR